MIRTLINWSRLKRKGVPLGFVDVLCIGFGGGFSGSLIEALERNETGEMGITVAELESHQLCGGDPDRVLEALEMAQHWELKISWDDVCSIDLLSYIDPCDAISAYAKARADDPSLEFWLWLAPLLDQPLSPRS